MPLKSALGRQKQADLCKIEASLVCVWSSKPAWATYIMRLYLKKKKKAYNLVKGK